MGEELGPRTTTFSRCHLHPRPPALSPGVTSTPGQIRYAMFLAHRKQSINGDFYHPLFLNIGGSGMFWFLDFGVKFVLTRKVLVVSLVHMEDF